ncbi:MAG: DNA methylase, partial [Oscillospiraceae bacterium]
ILAAVMGLFESIVNRKLTVRRVNLVANHIIAENDLAKTQTCKQLDLFTDYTAEQEEQTKLDTELEREKKAQKAMLSIKKKFGKNAILKGINLEEGATTINRNKQIGGHKA